MIVHLLLGFVCYAASTTLMYLPSWRASALFMPVGIGLSVAANALWTHLAKATPSAPALYVNGLIWDAMLVGTYAVIPVLFFGVRFTAVNSLGVALVIVGFILLKV